MTIERDFSNNICKALSITRGKELKPIVESDIGKALFQGFLGNTLYSSKFFSKVKHPLQAVF